MRVVVLAVGRAKRAPIGALFREYAARVPWRIELVEVAEKRPLPPERLTAREGELLLAAVPRDAFLIALDRRGKSLTSEAFARKIEAWRSQGASDLAFLIGGAEGLGEAVLEKADFCLSLGPMTWPHLLVRVLLAEQLYRAASILAGHPYHRG